MSQWGVVGVLFKRDGSNCKNGWCHVGCLFLSCLLVNCLFIPYLFVGCLSVNCLLITYTTTTQQSTPPRQATSQKRALRLHGYFTRLIHRQTAELQRRRALSPAENTICGARSARQLSTNKRGCHQVGRYLGELHTSIQY